MFLWYVPVDRGILPAIDVLSNHALVGVSSKCICYSIFVTLYYPICVEGVLYTGPKFT
jgi:hypothetical protein